MNETDKMKIALLAAEKSLKNGELPIGAAVFLNDSLLVSAHTTESRDKRLLVHAELNALTEIDKMNLSFSQRKNTELYTTLEPCMMCLGAAIASFTGSVFYGMPAPSDGAAEWALKTWHTCHTGSVFRLPKIKGNICAEESRVLFEQFLIKNPSGPLSEWVKTLLQAAV